jgi:hypothetical protein
MLCVRLSIPFLLLAMFNSGGARAARSDSNAAAQAAAAQAARHWQHTPLSHFATLSKFTLYVPSLPHAHCTLLHERLGNSFASHF